MCSSDLDVLVERGVLTRFQATKILAGHRKLTLGQYRILDLLGQGGMGQVFKAEHAMMGREVAVKVLPRAKSTPDTEAAFRREIRMLGRLDHPNLVRALDAGHDGKVYYLVTELVEGVDLRKQVLRYGTLDEVAAALGAFAGGYEIVVVDDASTDRTRSVLEGARRPGLVVVRHRRNGGQSAALFTGVRVARGAWVATLDGDGQNDPADIPALWQMRSGASADLKMIAGHRRRRQDTWLKRMSSRVANRVRGRLLGDDTPDTGCGLKLFERDLFLRLPHFDHFHRFLPALAQQAGSRVASVEVRHRPRRTGRSHYGLHNRLWVGIVDLLGVMWLKRRSGRWRPEMVEVVPDQADR